MDFFREKKRAEVILSSFAQSGNMYLWEIADAYQAAIYIFGLDSADKSPNEEAVRSV